jgi:hypothetical protein
MEPNKDDELSRVLQEWQVPGAPAQLESRVMSVRRGPSILGWRFQLLWAATSAVLVIIGVLLSGVPVQTVKPPPVFVPAMPLATDGEAPFVPVPYVAPLDSYETGTVLRVNVPVAMLIAAGYRVPVTDPTATVLADVLVGDDGRAHAVRLVSGLSLESGGD